MSDSERSKYPSKYPKGYQPTLGDLLSDGAKRSLVKKAKDAFFGPYVAVDKITYEILKDDPSFETDEAQGIGDS